MQRTRSTFALLSATFLVGSFATSRLAMATPVDAQEDMESTSADLAAQVSAATAPEAAAPAAAAPDAGAATAGTPTQAQAPAPATALPSSQAPAAAAPPSGGTAIVHCSSGGQPKEGGRCDETHGPFLGIVDARLGFSQKSLFHEYDLGYEVVSGLSAIAQFQHQIRFPEHDSFEGSMQENGMSLRAGLRYAVPLGSVRFWGEAVYGLKLNYVVERSGYHQETVHADRPINSIGLLGAVEVRLGSWSVGELWMGVQGGTDMTVTRREAVFDPRGSLGLGVRW